MHPAVSDDVFAGSEAYLEQRAADSGELEGELDVYLERLRGFIDVDRRRRLLEVGVGTGWLLVAAAGRGFDCEGVEHNPHNAEYARSLAKRHGLDLNVRVASVEGADLEPNSYDLVFALSVFEHVRDVDAGLRNIHAALAPGGALYFYSTNKFAPRSGEYAFPLYGWLPLGLRRRLRVGRQGERIVASGGFDFHQFTYWGLRRKFTSVGFSRVVDQFELLRPDAIAQPTRWKRALAMLMHRFPPLRAPARLFASGTCFICVK